MNFNDNFSPEFFANGFLCIQREIFVEICRNFSENVSKKNSEVFNRSLEFSKDFNNFDFDLFEDIDLNEENFPYFCNFIFDFMNYVRKVDEKLYKNSIEFAEKKLSFPNLPTLDKSVKGCGRSLAGFLEWRENIPSDFFENEDDDDDDDE